MELREICLLYLFVCLFKIGEVRVCVYAEGNNPTQQEKLIIQEKMTNVLEQVREDGTPCKVEGMDLDGSIENPFM